MMNYYKKYKSASLKLDHAYIAVSDLDEAKKAYETLLGMDAKNHEGDRWIDFHHENKTFLGLKNEKYLPHPIENTGCIVLRSDDIQETYNNIKDMDYFKPEDKPKQDEHIDFEYLYFIVEDKDGNKITVCQYEDKYN